MMDSTWSSYMKLRILIGVPDMLLDCVQSFRLLHEGQALWGLLLLLWIVLPCITSLLYVTFQMLRKRQSMPLMKFLVLVLTTHIGICQPLFESGPELVTQWAVFWSGIHHHEDIDFSFPSVIFWVCIDIISIVLSFISLIFTAIKFNSESGTLVKISLSVTCSIFSLAFRVFIFSILFYTSPYTFIAFTLLYVVNAGLYYYLDRNISCLFHAYFFIYLPIGHNQASKFKNFYIQPKLCESENSKVNQEDQINQIKKIFGINLLQNYVLLIYFFAVYEVLVHPYSDSYSTILVSRQLIYNVSYPLIFLLTLFSYMYYYEANKTQIVNCADLETTTNLVEQQVQSNQPGNRKCGSQDCTSCPRLEEGPCFFSSQTKRHYTEMKPLDCTSSDLIYLITCKQCRKQYVGQTERSLHAQTSIHIGQIKMQSSFLGQHFGGSCGTENWRIQIIEKCSNEELPDRRHYWQQELQTGVPHGLNNMS